MPMLERALWTGQLPGKVNVAPPVMSDLATQPAEKDIPKLRWVEMAEELWAFRWKPV